MRFSVAVFIGALASTVSASLVARQLPACVGQCMSQADFDGCQPTDNGCLCRSDKFVSSSTLCIGQTCQGADLQAALDAARELCAVVGVTLTSTPSGFPTSAAGSATATAPAATTTASRPAGGSSSGAGTATGAASSPAASNAASANGVNALAGIAALGLAALAL